MTGVWSLLVLSVLGAAAVFTAPFVRRTVAEHRRDGLLGPPGVEHALGADAGAVAAGLAAARAQELADEDVRVARTVERLSWVGARLVAVERLTAAWWRLQFSDGTVLRLCSFQPRLVRRLRQAASWAPTVPQRAGRGARHLSLEFTSARTGPLRVTAERVLTPA